MMRRLGSAAFGAWCALVILLVGCTAGDGVPAAVDTGAGAGVGPATAAAPAAPTPASATAEDLHGRLEQHGGLPLLRLWGTPDQRGYAHGRLLGRRITALATAELQHRFGRRAAMLEAARNSLPRLIEYPEHITQELEAIWRGVLDSGAARTMPEFGRDMDLCDLQLCNAMDVFGLLGCSGFTVSGAQVEGGGVLCGRNFDWPLTGPYLVDEVLVIVQHLGDGRAVASVAWPGYIGTVTGVASSGVAAFLHVGSAGISLFPIPDSWPSATAVFELLAGSRRDGGEANFDVAQAALDYTSPPAGFITHVVLPEVSAGGAAAGVFEACSRQVVRVAGPHRHVITNHFVGRSDGRRVGADSKGRHDRICNGIDQCLTTGDRAVSVDEAWELLRGVQRGGGHAFGTLHSLVYRHEPWVFELRVGEWKDGKVVAAPGAARHHRLTREQLFAEPGAAAGRR